MGAALLDFGFASLVVLAAGVLLTRCADRLAELSGLGRVFVGSVFLAGATSLPELGVSLEAARQGAPDLAAGGLLGSSLMNLLILAILDSAGVSAKRAFGHDSRHHAFTALLSIFLTAWVGLACAAGGGREFAGAGIFAWMLAAAYFAGQHVNWLDERAAEEGPPVRLNPPSAEMARPALGYFAAAAAILWVSPHLASSAGRLAQVSGLGDTFVGTTALALATSLPEIVATIAAFRLGAPDLALGNIFGSNAFNMILFLPLDFAHPGSFFASVSPTHAFTAFAAIAASTLGVMGQVLRPRQTRAYHEPSAPLIGALVIALLWLLYRAGR